MCVYIPSYYSSLLKYTHTVDYNLCKNAVNTFSRRNLITNFINYDVSLVLLIGLVI